MKKIFLFCIFVAIAVILLSAIAVGAMARADDGRDRLPKYDVEAERTFEGAILSKGHEVEGLVYVPIRMMDEILEIQVGPRQFIEHSGFTLKIGEMVTVVGMPAVVKNREVVLAREVRTMNSVLVVRDYNGQPMWQTDRPLQMDPEHRDDGVRVCRYMPFVL